MYTIAVVNQKGGCGKTTSAINLAGVFASRGYRSLLVDLDPQAHCAAGLAIPEQRIDKHIGDAMLAAENSPIDSDRLLWRVSRNLDLAPSTVRLAALEAARGDLAQKPDAESRLKKALSRFGGQYDICLIDCSPAIGLLTFNALVAADEILIPVETAFFSLHGATKQVSTIKSVAKRLGVTLMYRLLPTMHDPASALARDLLEELRRRFPGRVTPVVIRLDQCLREAASFGQPVVEYSSDSLGAQDYGALATFLTEQSLNRKGGRIDASEVDADAEAKHPLPQVHVVPGIADRAALPVHKAAEPARPVAAFPDGRLVEPATPAHIAVIEAPVSPARSADAVAMIDPPAVFMPTRAADLVARARKLHARPETEPVLLHRSQPTPAPPVADAPDPVSPAPLAPPVSPADAIWFGVRVTPRGVIFRQPLTLGRSIRIAGEFNHWSDAATPLRPHPTLGVLEGVAQIAAGSTQYRVVVDSQWIADPYNPLVAPNPFGGANSIVYVPENDSSAAEWAASSGGLQ